MLGFGGKSPINNGIWEDHGKIMGKSPKNGENLPFQWENHEKIVILLGFEWGKYMVIYSETDHVGFE
jgi:hypothetical protein